MAKIKGIKKINAKLNRWLAANGFEDCEAKIYTEFMYDNNTIYWSPLLVEKVTKMFNKYINKKGCGDIEPFTISFLHELGHHNTIFSFSNCRYNLLNFIDKVVSKTNYRIANFCHFRLSHERVATEWAIDFIKNNPKQVKKLTSIFKKSLKEFYKKNKIGE